MWLDYDALAGVGDVERRLSQLSRWVIDAERENCLYGLRLPGVELAPSRGSAQFDRCLEALALFKPTAASADEIAL